MVCEHHPFLQPVGDDLFSSLWISNYPLFVPDLPTASKSRKDFLEAASFASSEKLWETNESLGCKVYVAMVKLNG